MNIKNLLIGLVIFMLSPCYATQWVDKNIIIFVSFSMPDESLKGWLREANMVNASVIVRGFVNNSFKDTINKIGALTKNNHSGVQIDPTLFQQFHVEKVPAVVVVKEPNCITGMSCIFDYDIIYGDVQLSYALKKIVDEEDDFSIIAKNALVQLDGMKYGQ
jgi:conjugal transfer pilus assembly protein TrbC